MAEKKISELTAKGAAVAATDLMVVSEVSGASYVTKSVTGANITALVTDANLTTTDITTNDVSTSKHGFVPKAPNDATKFLDGTGVFSVPAGGGLTNFTEAETTAAPNGTVYVDSLTAAASTTNADAAFIPKGTGAILAAIPDNTTVGGNKRGTYAVDWQIVRNAAARVASGAYSAIIGGYWNTSSGTASIAGGYQNQIAGDYSVGLGASNTTTTSNCFVLGNGSTASGAYGAVALGRGNTASGDGTLTAGFVNTASGSRSISLGESNTASASNAVAIGISNVANAANSLALGRQSNTFSIIGRQVYASGQEGTSGDSQASKFILRERTTNDTATTITTNSGAAGTTNQVILSNQSAYRFKGSIVGKQSGSVNAAVWDIDGFIVRGANAAATTLNVSNVTLVENTPAWGTPTLAADTTNGGLQVQVIGAAATNIQWTAVIETTEVIYA
jgi:hypothetical protein